METSLCPKCGGEIDQGFVTTTGGVAGLSYMPGSQEGKFWPKSIDLRRAKACLVCGYVEFYVDPDEIRKRSQS